MPRTAPMFPLPRALRPGETFVSLGRTQLPPGGTARLSTHPAADDSSPRPTYTARPNDGTEDGAKLALLKELLGATTVLWFDERAPEVLHAEHLDQLFVATLLRVLAQPKLVDEVIASHLAYESAAPFEGDEREALVKHIGELTREIGKLECGRGKASNEGMIARLVGVIEGKQAALTAAENKLATLKPRVTRTLDLDALRARAANKVVRLADILRRDIPAGRDALRHELARPAEAETCTGFLSELRLRTPFEVTA